MDVTVGLKKEAFRLLRQQDRSCGRKWRWNDLLSSCSNDRRLWILLFGMKRKTKWVFHFHSSTVLMSSGDEEYCFIREEGKQSVVLV